VQTHQRPLEKSVQGHFPADVQGVSPCFSLSKGVGGFALVKQEGQEVEEPKFPQKPPCSPDGFSVE